MGCWELPSASLMIKKSTPEQQFPRYAVEKLFELLIGHGITYSCLAKHTYVRGMLWNSTITDLLWISQSVEGDSLETVLNNQEKRDQLTKLDSRAFFRAIISEFAVQFDDGDVHRVTVVTFPWLSYPY